MSVRKTWLGLGAAALSLIGSYAPARAQPAVLPPANSPPVVECFDAPATGVGGVQAGASLYYLRPYINNNTAFVTTSGIGTPNPAASSTDFDWDYRAAPAFWLGYTGDSGLGARARFFQFDQSSNTTAAALTAADAATTTITPPAGLSPVVGVPPRVFAAPGILLQGGLGQDFLTAQSDLRIQTIDFETTYAARYTRFDLLFSGGGRYLQMSQNYTATLVNAPAPGVSETSVLASGHNFYGGGPTAAVQGRWLVGDSGLALFGLARGSLLVGSGRQNTFFHEIIVDPVNGNQNNLPSNRATYHNVLPVGELELGLEYGLNMSASRAFFRAAAVNQTYFDAGSASSRDGNLSLFGAQVSLGLNY